MISCDINTLIYAFNADAERHREYRAWLERVLHGRRVLYLADSVWSGFLRLTTNPKIFSGTLSLKRSLRFIEQLKNSPNCRPLLPGARHFQIFSRLCEEVDAKGNDIPDVYLAALCLESGCQWITTDRGFNRFKELRWQHPLES